jgi:hypothetical protein
MEPKNKKLDGGGSTKLITSPGHRAGGGYADFGFDIS